MIPLINPNDEKIIWHTEHEAVKALNSGDWVHARSFFLMKEAEYARLRCDVERKMALRDMQKIGDQNGKA